MVCKIKSPTISISDGINEHHDRVDILDVINLLIQDKPVSIRFTNAFLTENEELRLEAYCKESNYILTKDKRGLTLIHE